MKKCITYKVLALILFNFSLSSVVIMGAAKIRTKANTFVVFPGIPGVMPGEEPLPEYAEMTKSQKIITYYKAQIDKAIYSAWSKEEIIDNLGPVVKKAKEAESKRIEEEINNIAGLSPEKRSDILKKLLDYIRAF